MVNDEVPIEIVWPMAPELRPKNRAHNPSEMTVILGRAASPLSVEWPRWGGMPRAAK